MFPSLGRLILWMQTMWHRLLWLTLLSSPTQSEAAKVLAIPMSVNSHIFYFSQLGDSLAKMGHEVHIVIPSNTKIPRHLANENLTVVVYDVDGETPFTNSQHFSETLMKAALSDSKFEYISIMYSFGARLMKEYEQDCIQLLENQEVMDKIRKEKFDFAIMDP